MSDQPIHKAAQRGDVDALRRWLAKGVSPNALSQHLSGTLTPLHLVCHRGDNAKARVDCLTALVDAGADIHALDDCLIWTPLHLAAKHCPANVVAALIKAGADVNQGGEYNITPLHSACCRDDSDVEPALVLIRNGADLSARYSIGDTPLDRAIHHPRHRLVPILLRAGAALPAETDNAYIQKVIAAGGFETYKRIHLDALAATFAPHFAHLPPEIVRLVVEYAFHVGYY